MCCLLPSQAIHEHAMLQTRAVEAHLILLTTSLFVVVEDIVADVVFRFSDEQTCAFLDLMPSPTCGHCHSQEEQHCNGMERGLRVFQKHCTVLVLTILLTKDTILRRMIQNIK